MTGPASRPLAVERGLTLVELMASLGILLTVLALAGDGIRATVLTNVEGRGHAEDVVSLRTGLDRLTRDLRAAEALPASAELGAEGGTFSLGLAGKNDEVVYRLRGGVLDRVEAGRGKPIVLRVERLALTRDGRLATARLRLSPRSVSVEVGPELSATVPLHNAEDMR